MVKPRQQAPALDLALVSGGRWSLAEQSPEAFTLIVFYRGLHCPICSRQLAELTRKLPEFEKRGIGVIAVSGDSRERAEKTVADWDIDGLTLGYGQSETSMREWGLFVSNAISDKEPARFGEPGLFLVRPDGEIYFAQIASMPFARPKLDEILSAIDFVTARDYPPRGEA
ncbi:peroxiredoxin-like family protein [Oceanibacterium hippocampi]|uniref:AhpC/TSA family protein n=1 Tax=Oceanibacterium hippocampi TaxID=745714 RepID=A0A1Y5RVH3_9PROT|nr:peroxiredoxin-like family protein [Oceanibacterium hippocampi]SLN23529.1 AhpC/TSA family protein [Oceanibacterium hippocampi]